MLMISLISIDLPQLAQFDIDRPQLALVYLAPIGVIVPIGLIDPKMALISIKIALIGQH